MAGSKSPLYANKHHIWSPRLAEIERMLRGLRFESGQRVIESQQKTGFLGMIVNITSIRKLYSSLLDGPDPSLK